jgi:hypothetical protein
MRFYDSENECISTIQCRGSETEKLEFELQPGEKIIAANVTHTPKE